MDQNELYHHGILGMKWGHHKTKNNSISKDRKKREAFKVYQKQEKINKMIKDNDRRVKTYGKRWVKNANRINMAATAYSGIVVANVIKNIGERSIRRIAADPTKSDAQLRLAEAGTLAALGVIGARSINTIHKLHKDNKLADDYEYRQYLKKNKK